MSSPLQFYRTFKALMTARGIRHVLTSLLDATPGRDVAMSSNLPPEPTAPEFPEAYYEKLAELLGEDKARWARLPYEERMNELEWYHAHFNTPDDLSLWPAELDGGADRP